MFTRKLSVQEMEVIEKIAEFVKAKHLNQMGHDYSHVLEVVHWAIEIARRIEEPVDPFILLAGALLHDIGRVGAVDGSFHGIDGGARARECLESLIDDEAIILKVTKLVVRHTPTSMISPRTTEEKVVCDADGIDRLGLMGMVRGIMNKKGSMEFIIRDRIRKRMKDFEKFYFDVSRELAMPYYKETLNIVEMIENALDKRFFELKGLSSLKFVSE